MRLAIISGPTSNRNWVNFVSWALTISCSNWSRMTNWTLFCMEWICCLNVIYVTSKETISFIQHIRVLCLLVSQYPLLLYSFISLFSGIFWELEHSKMFHVELPVFSLFLWLCVTCRIICYADLRLLLFKGITISTDPLLQYPGR